MTRDPRFDRRFEPVRIGPVVSTEEVEIHPTSDISPFIEGRLWDDRDIPTLALLTDAIHRHGALAAIELVSRRCSRGKVAATTGAGCEIELLLNCNVVEYDGTHLAVECTYTGCRTMLAADEIVTVTLQC